MISWVASMAGLVSLCALLSTVLPAAGAAADVRGSFKELIEIRAKLQKQLEKKVEATKPQVLELRADEGADTYDLEMILKQSEGKWLTSDAWVPGWDQLTMNDYRSYFNSSHGTGFLIPRHRFPADASTLVLKDNKLSGKMPVAFKLDQTLMEKMPPGRKHNSWDKFEARGYLKDRPQTFTFDAKVDPACAGFEFVLLAGVEYPPAKNGAHNPLSPGLTVRLQAPGTRFVPVDVKVMGWNMGKHEGNAAGLKFENGRLTGDLNITIYSDGWYPNTFKEVPASAKETFTTNDIGLNHGKLMNTGKLLGRMPPILATYTLDAKLENNVLSGTYKATGDVGEFSGKVVGRGGQAVIGRYTSEGSMLAQAGMLRGMLYSDFGKVDGLLTQVGKLPSDDAEALKTIAEKVGDVVAETRALHLALQKHPLPFSSALAQVDVVRPAWPTNGLSAEAVAEYVAAAVDTLRSAIEPEAKAPVAVAEVGGVSLSSGASAMAVVEGKNAFPAKSEGWFYPTAWSLAGGFEARTGFEHLEAYVPDVVPVTATPLIQTFASVGRFNDPVKSVRAWTNFVSGRRVMSSQFKVWDQGLQKGQFCQAFYAVSRISSESDRKVWLGIEMYDYSKVWLNGKLLWTETRLKSYRQRPLGRFVAQGELKKGENILLVRMEQDRGAPWVTVAFTAQDPKADTPLPAPGKDLLAVKPEPVNPPMACDIVSGTNVLWRNAAMGGETAPAVAGGRVYLTSGHDQLVCLDATDGKKLWEKRVSSYEAVGLEADYQKALAGTNAQDRRSVEDKVRAAAGLWQAEAMAASAPISDGKVTIFANSVGTVVAFDADGKELWRKAIDVANPKVYRFGDTVVVQGLVGKSWQGIDYVSPAASDAKRQATGVTMFKVGDGAEIGRSSNNRKVEKGAFIQPRGADKVYYVANAFVVLDLETCKQALAIDTLSLMEQAITVHRDTIYMSAQGFAKAVLVYKQPDGRLAHRDIWEASTDRRYGIDAPGAVLNGQFWYWTHVVDSAGHCPDYRSSLYVVDAETGASVIRIKPIITSSVGGYSAPVPVGDYMALLAGSGGVLGDREFARMAMVSTDGNFLVAQPEMKLEFGAHDPVFVGDKLFVRSRASMMCVASKDKDFEAREKAAKLFKWIGPEPLQSKVVDIKPATDLAVGNDLPIAPYRGYPSDVWMGAGPFPGGGAPDEKLATLRPRIGDEYSLNGKALKFAALPKHIAGNVTPTFFRQYELQGTGDSMPAFDALLDPTHHSGTNASGLFYTLIDNTVERVLKPAYLEDQMRGITVWVNGYRIQKDEAMRLQPGLYPVMIRIDPEFYDRAVRLDEMPIDVAAALAANAVDSIAWPKEWKVLGPLPTSITSFEGAQLTTIPGSSVTIEDEAFNVWTVPAIDGKTLALLGLLHATKDSAFDWTKMPKPEDILTPYLAYCYAEVEVPADGSLYINAGGDWYMRWYVDGVGVCDTMQTGNKSGPLDVKASSFEVPVKKGKHVICVMTKPGTRGWSLSSIGAFSAKPKAELAAFEIKTKAAKDALDFRFRPCFGEVPNPPFLNGLYMARLKAAESRLKEVVKTLPGSVEAGMAEALLAKGKGK
jgi:hypothetical protein